MGDKSICGLLVLMVLVGVYFFYSAVSNSATTRFNGYRVLDGLLESFTKVSRCPCAADVPVNKQLNFSSFCSNRATNLGLNQRVLAYSLYTLLHSERNYSSFLQTRIDEMKRLYNGWRLRLYIAPYTLTSGLCSVACNSKIVDICLVDRLPVIGDVQDITAMTWRFLPLGDPTVEVFGSRDMDAELLQREVDAVNEWMESGRMFHIMRDNVQHKIEMLGGMWGARNYRKNKLDSSFLVNTSHYRDEFLKFKADQPFLKNVDQPLLKKLIYGNLKPTDKMEHDSYHCEKYPDSIPFPTQREARRSFVGGRSNNAEPCPVECRPQSHKDWTFC